MPLFSALKKKKKEGGEKEGPLFPELEKLKEEVNKDLGLSNPSSIFQDSPITQQSPGALQQPLTMQQTMVPPMYSQQNQQTLPSLPSVPTQPMESVPRAEEKLSSFEEKREEHHHGERPELYIKIDNYKEVISLLERLRVKIKDIESTLEKLRDINEKEKEHIDNWKKQLEDTKEKVDNILDLLRE